MNSLVFPFRSQFLKCLSCFSTPFASANQGGIIHILTVAIHALMGKLAIPGRRFKSSNLMVFNIPKALRDGSILM